MPGTVTMKERINSPLFGSFQFSQMPAIPESEPSLLAIANDEGPVVPGIAARIADHLAI